MLDCQQATQTRSDLRIAIPGHLAVGMVTGSLAENLDNPCQDHDFSQRAKQIRAKGGIPFFFEAGGSLVFPSSKLRRACLQVTSYAALAMDDQNLFQPEEWKRDACCNVNPGLVNPWLILIGRCPGGAPFYFWREHSRNNGTGY